MRKANPGKNETDHLYTTPYINCEHAVNNSSVLDNVANNDPTTDKEDILFIYSIYSIRNKMCEYWNTVVSSPIHLLIVKE
jgi:hypothetical protein